MFKKGNKVKCDIDGKTVNGIVIRGTTSVNGRIRVRQIGNSFNELAGAALNFKAAKFTLPKNTPSDMDKYSVVSYKEFREMSRDSTAFAAKIKRGKKVIAEATNDGWGGCTMIYPVEGRREALDTFAAEARKWAIRFGKNEKPIEPDDTWIFWWVHCRPYGMTAEMYLGKEIE